MRNITVSLPDDCCFTRARVRAAQRDTSVSALARLSATSSKPCPESPRAVKAFPLANSHPLSAKPAPEPPAHRETCSFHR
jgi:hypothetical protein